MRLGPVMLDLEGPVLSAEDREVLRDPAVGGVILFARNYQDPEQLTELTGSIHGLRDPHLLVAPSLRTDGRHAAPTVGRGRRVPSAVIVSGI